MKFSLLVLAALLGILRSASAAADSADTAWRFFYLTDKEMAEGIRADGDYVLVAEVER